MPENKLTMPGLELRVFSQLCFIIAVPLAATALVALLARRAHRHERTGVRLRAGELFRMLGGRLSGRVKRGELRRAVSRSAREPFWDAIEAIASTLRASERARLSASLAKSGHLAGERRVLASDEPAPRRELAARRLGFLPDPGSRRALRRALVRGPESVRFEAARALARHCDLRALRWLLEQPGALARRPLQALSGLL